MIKIIAVLMCIIRNFSDGQIVGIYICNFLGPHSPEQSCSPQQLLLIVHCDIVLQACH